MTDCLYHELLLWTTRFLENTPDDRLPLLDGPGPWQKGTVNETTARQKWTRRVIEAKALILREWLTDEPHVTREWDRETKRWERHEWRLMPRFNLLAGPEAGRWLAEMRGRQA